jgi:hypothetical protein
MRMKIKLKRNKNSIMGRRFKKMDIRRKNKKLKKESRKI